MAGRIWNHIEHDMAFPVRWTRKADNGEDVARWLRNHGWKNQQVRLTNPGEGGEHKWTPPGKHIGKNNYGEGGTHLAMAPMPKGSSRKMEIAQNIGRKKPRNPTLAVTPYARVRK